jgi:hypothetical protein
MGGHPARNIDVLKKRCQDMAWPAGPPLASPPGLCPSGPPGLSPTEQPNCRSPACRLAHWPPPTTERLQQHQTPAPNLPRRCRQTGLDAKGITPELLRLKFYCSWTRNFFFQFSLFFKCSSCLLSNCPLHLPVDFFGFSFFFRLFLLFLFFPSFLVLLVLLL